VVTHGIFNYLEVYTHVTAETLAAIAHMWTAEKQGIITSIGLKKAKQGRAWMRFKCGILFWASVTHYPGLETTLKTYVCTIESKGGGQWVQSSIV